jgi:hypothetical protein
MERYFHTEKYTVPETAVAKKFTMSFRPQWVKVINVTSKVTLDWFDTMADASGYKIKTGVDATADTVSLHTFITEKGITPAENGFTLGLDTDINATEDDVIHILAGRDS